MKVKIIVWNDDAGKMEQDTILQYDDFKYPEVIGYDVPIERCKYDSLFNYLNVYLDEYPARIDADPRYQTINLLSRERAAHYPNGHTLLDIDRGKGIILWTRKRGMAITENQEVS